MALTILPHPCAICQRPHTRPWPACDTLECRAAWHRMNKRDAKRRRYEFYVSQGRCGDCGTLIASNEKSRTTGTRPIARCASCRADQRKQRNAQNARARQRRLALQAAERVATTATNRRKANRERLAAGLPPSRSSKPTPPPQTIPQVQI